jgi:hypothetical protein
MVKIVAEFCPINMVISSHGVGTVVTSFVYMTKMRSKQKQRLQTVIPEIHI